VADHIAGKSIVITGAGSGFGKLVAQKAAALGAKVTLGDVNGDALDATVAEIRGAGGTAQGVVTDVTDLAAMKALVAAAVTHHGGIDVMVNNAGVMPLAFFADMAPPTTPGSAASTSTSRACSTAWSRPTIR
jgi:NAD(P)-dependent dehydrogenase (short-subunit alcohol dehydrogenase family)